MVDQTRRELLNSAARYVASAAAAATLLTGQTISAQEAPKQEGKNMAKQVKLKNQLGTPTIGLGLDFSLKTARQYLDFFKKNGLIEKGRPKPILEVLVAPGDNLDLTDRINKSYLKAFDGLAELFEEYGVDPVVLGFFPKGTNAHMVSENSAERYLALTYLMSAIDIARHIGAELTNGPVPTEHMEFDKPYKILNAVDSLKRASDYAGDDVVVTGEALRTEESVFNTPHEANELYGKVNRANVGFHADLCHGTAVGCKDLAAYIKSVKEIIKYLHLSRCEKWMTAYNRATLTKSDQVGKQLEAVYRALHTHEIIVPTTVECIHYGLGGAIGRKDPRLDAKEPTELDKIAREQTLASYRRAIEARNTVETRLSAAKR